MTLRILAAVALLLAWIGAPSYAQLCPPEVDCQRGIDNNGCLCGQLCAPAWTVTTEILWLQRSVGSDVLLAELRETGIGTVLDTLTTADSGFGMEAGLRVMLTREGEDGLSWELGYFGLQDWSVNRTLAADPVGFTTNVTSPILVSEDAIGGFDTSVDYTYSSTLHSAELNRRSEWSEFGYGAASVLIGFRYLDVAENVTLGGMDQLFGAFENRTTRSDNDLIGAQLGAAWAGPWRQMELDVSGKAGLFANINQNRLFAVGDPGTGAAVIVDAGSSTTSLAGMIEGGATLRYALSPACAVRVGYQVFYLTGLALAPRQLAGLSDDRGGLFWHGPSAGVDISW